MLDDARQLASISVGSTDVVWVLADYVLQRTDKSGWALLFPFHGASLRGPGVVYRLHVREMRRLSAKIIELQLDSASSIRNLYLAFGPRDEYSESDVRLYVELLRDLYKLANETDGYILVIAGQTLTIS